MKVQRLDDINVQQDVSFSLPKYEFFNFVNVNKNDELTPLPGYNLPFPTLDMDLPPLVVDDPVTGQDIPPLDVVSLVEGKVDTSFFEIQSIALPKVSKIRSSWSFWIVECSLCLRDNVSQIFLRLFSFSWDIVLFIENFYFNYVEYS